MSSLPLDELYLQWLYGQVDDPEEDDPTVTHWELLRLLFQKEFVWLIHNDDNRVADGKDLRPEFLRAYRLRHVDQHWMELGCSFLEMLIALSRRLAFESEGDARSWFWHLIHTLNLHQYTDDMDIPTEDVEEILNTVIWRTYRRDGQGGLFPLKHPKQDQTEVEIWYQLNLYLIENGI